MTLVVVVMGLCVLGMMMVVYVALHEPPKLRLPFRRRREVHDPERIRQLERELGIGEP